jgi:hypothetical protein
MNMSTHWPVELVDHDVNISADLDTIRYMASLLNLLY